MINRLRLLFFLSFIATLAAIVECESKNSNVGSWQVKDPSGKTCIILKAEIKLGLQYIQKQTNNLVSAPEILVPVTSTTVGSSCSTTVLVDGESVSSQIIRLTFDKSKPDGWYLELILTKNKFGASSNEYVLYMVNINANYSSMLDIFPKADDDLHLYKPDPLVVNGKLPEIATVVYAESDYSFFCPSKQKFDIIAKEDEKPAAWIQFRYLQLEAYAKSDSFSEKDICPADQHEDDLLPIIVGSALAGLVVITLIAYLVYRCRLPPEVINLTNPHSHFDDFAGFDNRAALTADSVEEGEEREEVNLGKRNGNASLVQRNDSSIKKNTTENCDVSL